MLETCKGAPDHLTFARDLEADPALFENLEKRVGLGWFLREAGPRWTSIQIMSSAQDYCNGFESDKEVQTDID